MQSFEEFREMNQPPMAQPVNTKHAQFAMTNIRSIRDTVNKMINNLNNPNMDKNALPIQLKAVVRSLNTVLDSYRNVVGNDFYDQVKQMGIKANPPLGQPLN